MARKFGEAGSLTVDSPGLLQRRDAVMGMANDTRQERNLYKRTMRSMKRDLRRGDSQAGVEAIKLLDQANARGVELNGIPSANEGYQAGAMELRDGQEFAARSQGLVNTPTSLLPPSAQTPDMLRAEQELWTKPDPNNPWPEQSRMPSGLTNTPNETLATGAQFSDNPIVGGESGIEVTRNTLGPSAGEGGLLGAARRASDPIWSSRRDHPAYSEDPQNIPESFPRERANADRSDYAGQGAMEPTWQLPGDEVSKQDLARLDAEATPGTEYSTPIPLEKGHNTDGIMPVDPQYGGQSGSVTFGGTLDQAFRKRYPASSRLLDMANPPQPQPKRGAPPTASLPSTDAVHGYRRPKEKSSLLPGNSEEAWRRGDRISRTA